MPQQREENLANKMILAGIAVVAVAGTVVGLGLSGVVKIPGLTPASKHEAKKDEAQDPQADAKKADKAKPPAPKAIAGDSAKASAKRSTTPPDKDAGYKKVAAVWAEMKPDDLAGILTQPAFKNDADVACIFKQMDDDQVAAILTKLASDPRTAARAGALTKAIEAEASKIPAKDVGSGT